MIKLLIKNNKSNWPSNKNNNNNNNNILSLMDQLNSKMKVLIINNEKINNNEKLYIKLREILSKKLRKIIINEFLYESNIKILKLKDKNNKNKNLGTIILKKKSSKIKYCFYCQILINNIRVCNLCFNKKYNMNINDWNFSSKIEIIMFKVSEIYSSNVILNFIEIINLKNLIEIFGEKYLFLIINVFMDNKSKPFDILLVIIKNMILKNY